MFDLSDPKNKKKLYIYPDPEGPGKRADVCISLGTKLFWYDEHGRTGQPSDRWLRSPVKGVYEDADSEAPISLEEFINKVFDGSSVGDFWYQVIKHEDGEAEQDEQPAQQTMNDKVTWRPQRNAPSPPDGAEVRVNFEKAEAAWRDADGDLVTCPLLAPLFKEYECEALFVEYDKAGGKSDLLTSEPMWVSTALKLLPGVGKQVDRGGPSKSGGSGNVAMVDPRSKKGPGEKGGATPSHAKAKGAAAKGAAKAATPQTLAGKRGRPARDEGTATPQPQKQTANGTAPVKRATRAARGKDEEAQEEEQQEQQQAGSAGEGTAGTAAAQEEDAATAGAAAAPAAKRQKRLVKGAGGAKEGTPTAPAAAQLPKQAAAASDDDTRQTKGPVFPAPFPTASGPGTSPAPARRAQALLRELLDSHLVSLSNEDIKQGFVAFSEQLQLRFSILEARAREKRGGGQQ